MVNTTNINWTDTDRDFTPDCDLLDPAPNGECRGWSSPTFGQAVPGATFDDLLRRGFGHRESNWEFSAGIQHQLMQGVSIDVGYFRRIWQNLGIEDDLALGPADFDMFAITEPSDPRLPGGGGYTLDGFRAIKEEAFGRPNDVLHTLAKKYGTWTEHWDGVDALFAKYEKRPLGEKMRLVGEAVPYGRMGRAEDLTGMAVFLAGPESEYVVGQTYNVDGGNWLS